MMDKPKILNKINRMIIVLVLSLSVWIPAQPIHAQDVTPTPYQGWYLIPYDNTYNGGNGMVCPTGDYAGGFYVDVGGVTVNAILWPNYIYPSAYSSGRLVYTFNSGLTNTSVDWGSYTEFVSQGHYSDKQGAIVYWYNFPNNYGYPGAIACYGDLPNQPTQTPTLSPTPDPEVTCTVEGQNVSVDLVPDGFVTGSLSAIPYDYSNPNDLIDVINFSISGVIPKTYGSPGQDRQGTIRMELGGANIQYIDSWINDTFVPMTPTELMYIPVEGGQTTTTVSYTGYVHRNFGDQNPGDTPRITAIWLGYVSANDGTQLICDGGMNKTVSDTPWLRTNDEEFGRGWMDWFGAFNGFPACEPGQQSIAHQGYTGVGAIGSFTAVRQPFYMPIGSSTLNYKIRYRSRPEAAWLGLYPGTPNVYIADESGTVIGDLIGTNSYDPALIATDWTLITGSMSLSPGKYYVVLNQGYKFSGGSPDLEYSGQLYYDDVQLTTGAVDTGCSDWVNVPPEQLPTSTPTASPTPTMTGTVPTATPTPPLMGTASATLRSTPSRTSTLQSTPTVRSTGTSTITSTLGSTSTPVPSVTQHWTGPTGTTAPTNTGTPQTEPGWWPGLEPGPPSDSDGNYPGTNPGTGEITCERPNSILAFAWWLDYERCLIMAGITWGPNQSATLVAIPAMMTTKEPFNSVYQIGQGLISMQTQAAVYAWNNTGMSGVNANNVNPDPRFIFASNLANPGQASSSSPWDGNGTIPLTLNTSAASSSSYSKLCNTSLSNMMAARLGEGLCFVLNVTRSMGYLGWVQFGANAAILFSIVRLFLGAIRYYSFFGQPKTGATKSAAEDK
jgi:hypothetical protein